MNARVARLWAFSGVPVWAGPQPEIALGVKNFMENGCDTVVRKSLSVFKHHCLTCEQLVREGARSFVGKLNEVVFAFY
ncbi:MAG: hypothetical protein U5K79_00465 [Cyclobacteriaceae bacterium]|nr:hypothetical protein [Cyclobacteriaceae bacterium]